MSTPRNGAFAWADYFETGFAEVDEQHHKLVELINRLGDRLATGRALSREELEHVLNGLRKYAAQHFSTEEQMMSRCGIDRRHFDEHCRAHATFSAQVDLLAAHAGENQEDALSDLVRYASSWLAFHILGIDMAMARQLRAIDKGASAGEAYERDAREADPANTALVSAVHTLYRTVAERNAALIKAHAELELRVAERTAELQEAVQHLEAAREEIVQAEKMAALGQFAAGMAHELNTPLGYVGGNLNALGDYCTRLLALSDQADQLTAGSPLAMGWKLACDKADRAFIREDVPELLSESRAGLERITRIVDGLRRSAIGVAEVPVRTELGALLERQVLELTPTLPAGVRIEFSAGVPVSALVSPHAIASAIEEILDNAVKTLAGRSGVIHCGSGHDADHVWIEIADDGPGVDAAVAARIFEPFFTTRPVGSGAGLGLYLAYQTARQHGGHVELRHTGPGAAFRLTLPKDG